MLENEMKLGRRRRWFTRRSDHIRAIGLPVYGWCTYWGSIVIVTVDLDGSSGVFAILPRHAGASATRAGTRQRDTADFIIFSTTIGIISHNNRVYIRESAVGSSSGDGVQCSISARLGRNSGIARSATHIICAMQPCVTDLYSNWCNLHCSVREPGGGRARRAELRVLCTKHARWFESAGEAAAPRLRAWRRYQRH
jgi:hypothetical protein